ncbi:rootletin-like [Panicum virgatum]|uniref:rootletin-like n=1 Tax=Panicum virgatum TaxID=38727 RepID=UPI0019D4FC78|nr:rootletin-like [Panicum virgatum]
MSTGGDGSAASAGAPAQTASRPQAAPRVTPSDQSSRGVGVPRARKSGTGQMQHDSGAVAKDAAQLAPTKALKTGARATPHSAPQALPVVDIVAEAAKLREAMARGAQAAQQARAPGKGSDAGQSGAGVAAPADTVGGAGRGGADDAAQPDVGAETGRGDTDSAARPVTEEGSGGGAQERPASQAEAVTLVPGPPGAGVEGVVEESKQRAPVAEEACVSGPAEARDEGVIAVMTAPMAPVQAATNSVIPVVQLPDSSEEYGDSRDIDPAAAASAANKIAEFTSACVEVLDEGTSGGPQHGAIIQSVVPSEFLRDEREEEAAWLAQYEAGSQIQNHLECTLQLHRTTDYQISQRLRDISREKSTEMTRLYSQVRWLGQHNTSLVLRSVDANTKMADLEARQQALEEELARTAGERDVQRAAAEQKAQEAEGQNAELQRTRTAFELNEAELQRKEAELQDKEAELQRERATVATLTGTLEEKGKALEEREEALRNAEAALKEKENSLCSLEEAARVQREEAQKSIAAIMDDADAAAEEFAVVLAEKLEADIPPIAEFDAVADPQRGDDNL